MSALDLTSSTDTTATTGSATLGRTTSTSLTANILTATTQSSITPSSTTPSSTTPSSTTPSSTTQSSITQSSSSTSSVPRSSAPKTTSIENFLVRSTVTVHDPSLNSTSYLYGLSTPTLGSTSTSIVTIGFYPQGESVPPTSVTVPGKTVTVKYQGIYTPTIFSYTGVFISGVLNSSSSSTSGSTTSTALPNHRASKQLSHGAVAGISIACFIIGALLAVLAFLLFTKKLKNPRAQGTVDIPLSNAKTRDIGNIKSHDDLLTYAADINSQPPSGTKITGEMLQLGMNIKNHAARFYKNGALDTTNLDESALSGMGMDQKGISALMTMLASTDKRESAIRYIIARKIFLCIAIPGDPNTSFLPAAAVECMRNMSASMTGDGERISSIFSASFLTSRRAIDSSK
jgi:hypothetical protein